MRSEEEIITLILNIAKNDKRVRAVLLNGSRANPNVKKDRLQDFDIVYIVTEIKTFLNDHDWINIFGERLILQMPKEMVIGEKSDDSSFQYLMLFKDGNRTKTGFTVSFGKDGRNMRGLISTDLYEKILSTYPDSNTENTWNSLFRMTELFHDLAKKIANRMNFNYNENEAYNVTGYLKWAHDIHTQKS